MPAVGDRFGRFAENFPDSRVRDASRGVGEVKEGVGVPRALLVRLQTQGGRMIRQTPSRRLRVVAVAVAGAGMVATAALAATSTAPNGSYGKLPGYGGYSKAKASGSDFGSGGSDGSGGSGSYSDPGSSGSSGSG